MANLPSQHPNLSLHLADRTLTPLVTSSQTQEQQQSLASVSRAALVAYESALRLGLGSPQRIMVEHSSDGPILLQSFISPTVPGTAAARSFLDRPRDLPSSVADHAGDDEGEPHPKSNQAVAAAAAARAQDEPDATEDGSDAPPMLLSTVIAPSAESALEARRVSARLERVGREVQTKWNAGTATR